ncbi:hypothetical protein Tco_0731799 [Tanacetum coccineum]
MAQDVHLALQIIVQEQGSLDSSKATDYMKDLQAAEDTNVIFGNLLKTSRGTVQYAKAGLTAFQGRNRDANCLTSVR